jgi:hypothetical protein
MKVLQKLNRWHQTKPGLITFIVAEAALAYLFGSWSIDSGSLLDYTITFLLVVGTVQNSILLIRAFLKGDKHALHT